MKTIAAPLLLSLCAALAVGACANRGRSADGGGGSEPAQEGIQTRGIRSAPPSRAMANDSRPLSEMNTPEAIAAREAEARAAPRRPAPAAPAPAVATAATAAPAAALIGAPPAVASPAVSTAHQQNAALQKGSKVRARSGAVLRARPSVNSDGVPAPAATELELGAQIYNADGYWYFVKVGKDSGWLLQSDIGG